MLKDQKFYSVYLTEFAVEIRDEEKDCSGSAELVYGHHSYADVLRFAQELAQAKGVTVQNYSHFETLYEY